GRLVPLLLAWSYEGTVVAEEIVQRVARAYDVPAEAVFQADAAILTVAGETTAFAREPLVPPLDQVSDFKALVLAIEGGRLSAEAALARLDALAKRPARLSQRAPILRLGLFSTGFGTSVQATGQEIIAAAVLGLVVGVIAVAAQDHPRLTVVAPFVASVTVSTVTLLVYKHGWIDGGPIQLMVPCLFFFIPGD